MSDRLILKVWERCSEGGSPLALLQAIAEAANEQGNCYLTMADLAAAARMSRENAFRALRRLKAERWVVTSRILGQGGTLVFQVNEPKLGRSARPRHSETRIHRQRCRRTGATEAALVESVGLRGVGCQVATATSDSGESTLKPGRFDGMAVERIEAEMKVEAAVRRARDANESDVPVRQELEDGDRLVELIETEAWRTDAEEVRRRQQAYYAWRDEQGVVFPEDGENGGGVAHRESQQARLEAPIEAETSENDQFAKLEGFDDEIEALRLAEDAGPVFRARHRNRGAARPGRTAW